MCSALVVKANSAFYIGCESKLCVILVVKANGLFYIVKASVLYLDGESKCGVLEL